jgi:hypothetical protein
LHSPKCILHGAVELFILWCTPGDATLAMARGRDSTAIDSRSILKKGTYE